MQLGTTATSPNFLDRSALEDWRDLHEQHRGLTLSPNGGAVADLNEDARRNADLVRSFEEQIPDLQPLLGLPRFLQGEVLSNGRSCMESLPQSITMDRLWMNELMESFKKQVSLSGCM